MAYVIAGAFILDCLLGDPQNPFHPVRFIGSLIGAGTNLFKKRAVKSRAANFAAGMALSLITIGVSYAAVWLVTRGCYLINHWLGIIVEAALCYFIIAARALKDESMKVQGALATGDISGARKNLSHIVGRDTENLEAPEIARAAVETVAENLSDGVIAPLIFILIGGAPLGMAYKAVNTLDSMIGYRNEEYEYFGKFAARLDDIVNFIPSRFSALMMIVSCLLTGNDAGEALRVFARDRRGHASPNSAQTESACAGALGLRLGGDSFYRGKLVSKPVIGDGANEPGPEHITAANRLMYASAALTTALLILACAALGMAGFVGYV